MDGQRQMHTLATDTVLDLCRDLIRRFQTQRAPMPLVVLQAVDDDPDDRATEIIDVMHSVFGKGCLLCRRLVADADAAFTHSTARLRHYDNALAMARSLATSAGWDNRNQCQYKPYAFRRSRMLAAIEHAVEAAGQECGEGKLPSTEAVLAELTRLRWRPARSAGSRVRQFFDRLLSPEALIGSFVLTVSTTLVTRWSNLVIGVLLGSVLLIAGARAVYEKVAPLSWRGSASHWFATTTFLSPMLLATVSPPEPGWLLRNPRQSLQVIQARARLVAEQLIIARYGGASSNGYSAEQERALQFCLQLRVLALLEDLRVDHRLWAADMRGRKRTYPPMVFIPRADDDNGGVTFLEALSDVRSRRSEIDPLLVLASVPRGIEIQHRHGLPRGINNGHGLYAEWATGMRVGQSPSLGSTWPWVLRLPLTRVRLADQSSDKRQPRARRSIWALWSRWTVAAALLLLVVAGAYRNSQLAGVYCGGGLFGSDHDLVWSAQRPAECVGIDTTGAREFVPADGGVRLNGTLPGQRSVSPAVLNVSLAGLENLIEIQNLQAMQAPSHVTFVFAGALTSGSQNETQSLGAVRELAGVYTYQWDANKNNPVKVKIDIANGGLDLNSQTLMAQKIADAARHDPTIVGVIGLARNTPTSQAAVRELTTAGLVVVDTTNSSNTLPLSWNYFGLAATNSEEANSLEPEIVGHKPKNNIAILFTRFGDDPYSREQASAALRMLRKAGLTVLTGKPMIYEVTGNQSNIDTSGLPSRICGTGQHPSVIYLAGRSDDLPGLMNLLEDHANCFATQVIVLSGDDLSKDELTAPPVSGIPPNVTVYYTALTDTAKTGPASMLAPDTKNALRLNSTPSYSDPYFADGAVALAYDAAHALYQAAAQADGNRFGVASALRCLHLTNGATGPIWFNRVHHGIVIVKAAGQSQPTISKQILATGSACPSP